MKKILICILIITMLLLACSCKVKPQTEEVALPDSEQAADSGEQAKQDSSEQKEEETAVQTVSKQVTLTENTENHYEKIDLKSEKSDKTTPTSKTVTIDGKEIKLTFSEKKNICNSWYQYDYVDSDGIIYMFYEDEGFVGIYNKTSPERGVPTTVTEAETVEIAKDYALKLFGDEFAGYELTKSYTNNGDEPIYVHHFSKKYGKDGCLKGEVCSVEVYRNGQIKRCYIRDLFAFKDFDAYSVAGITNQDIEKAVQPLLERDYKNIADRNVNIDSVSIQCSKQKWVIFVNVTLTNKQTNLDSLAYYCFDIN